MHGRHCAPLAVEFGPSRYPLLSSKAQSKRLLKAALFSVRGQSNFPANHPQFLTLLRALETCSPSPFAYGNASSCWSSAFVVDCLQLPLHFLYAQLQLAEELRSGLTCTPVWRNTPRNVQESNSAWVGPKRNRKYSTVPPRRGAEEKSQGVGAAQEGHSRSRDVWSHHLKPLSLYLCKYWLCSSHTLLYFQLQYWSLWRCSRINLMP